MIALYAAIAGGFAVALAWGRSQRRRRQRRARAASRDLNVKTGKDIEFWLKQVNQSRFEWGSLSGLLVSKKGKEPGQPSET